MLSVFSSPGHYVQGRDATAVLGPEMVRLGLTGPVLVLEGAPSSEIAQVLDFCRAVGLPVTLGGLGLAGVVRTIAERTVAPGETIHNEPFAVDATNVADALVAAHAMGLEYGPAAG